MIRESKRLWLVVAVVALLAACAPTQAPPEVTPVDPTIAAALAAVSKVSAGDQHTCVVVSGGAVNCWGDNTYGQLGDRTLDSSGTAVVAFGVTNATAVVAGDTHSCAVISGGTLKCWGQNTYGQLGIGVKSAVYATPITVPGLTGVTAVALGRDHTCVIVSGGVVKCVGNSNVYNQLGVVNPGPSLTFLTVPGVTATSIQAGGDRTCALVTGGTVKCWGYNVVTSNGEGPTTIANLTGVTSLSTAGSIGCAVVSGGTAKCWGSNSLGYLADGTTTSTSSAVNVLGLTGVTTVSVTRGGGAICAVVTGGALKCWGRNSDGEMGLGTRTSAVQTSPVTIPGVTGAIAVSAGSKHTCVVIAGGALSCWGLNTSGQVGTGIIQSAVPVVISGVAGATDLAVGGDHACAIVTGGAVVCWGDNTWGQLGNGTTTSSPSPLAVSGITGATQIAADLRNTCAIVAGGVVRCWGHNANGELGNGTLVSSTVPVPVTDITGAISIDVAYSHSCAALSTGAVKCWGTNNDGERGGNPTVANTPATVNGVTGATVVGVAGVGPFVTTNRTPYGGHSCAVVTAGAVRCWGFNITGQLGSGSTGGSNSPRTASGVAGAIGVTAGGDNGWGSMLFSAPDIDGRAHTCAVMADGSVKCWGSNFWGELGNGLAPKNSATPALVSGLSNASRIAAGLHHVCAVRTTGVVSCWGANEAGQLGSGRTVDTPLPVDVYGIAGAIDVAAEQQLSCARLAGGTVACWGSNTGGTLGTDPGWMRTGVGFV